jgi:hypothetical protein
MLEKKKFVAENVKSTKNSKKPLPLKYCVKFCISMHQE